MPEDDPYAAMESVLARIRDAEPDSGAISGGLVPGLLRALAGVADMEAMKTTAFPQPDDPTAGILVIRRAEHDRADWAFHRRVVVFVEGGRVARYFTAVAASGFGHPPPGTFDA